MSEAQTRARRGAVRALTEPDEAAMIRLGRLRARAAERARAIVSRDGAVRGV